MPHDTPAESLIAAAEASLAAASSALLQNDLNSAADHLETAVTSLLDAGSVLLTSVQQADIAVLEGSLARILRALAERFGLLPEDHQPILFLLPESVNVLDVSTQTAAKTHLPISEVCATVRSVYESKDTDGLELSEEELNTHISAVRLLIDLLLSQRTLADTVFAENGAYDAFSDVASPYLISGAAFVGGRENSETYEEKIPQILAGPVKRLVELLAALLTSAFMSGLILLIIRRVLAVRKVRPGMVDNIIFAGSVAALVAANIPALVDGVKQVAAELRNLQQIIEKTDGGIEIPIA